MLPQLQYRYGHEHTDDEFDFSSNRTLPFRET
jgi:hypothetical protein